MPLTTHRPPAAAVLLALVLLAVLPAAAHARGPGVVVPASADQVRVAAWQWDGHGWHRTSRRAGARVQTMAYPRDRRFVNTWSPRRGWLLMRRHRVVLDAGRTGMVGHARTMPTPSIGEHAFPLVGARLVFLDTTAPRATVTAARTDGTGRFVVLLDQGHRYRVGPDGPYLTSGRGLAYHPVTFAAGNDAVAHVESFRLEAWIDPYPSCVSRLCGDTAGGATVRLTRRDTGAATTAVADRYGTISLGGLAPGTYDITARDDAHVLALEPSSITFAEVQSTERTTFRVVARVAADPAP